MIFAAVGDVVIHIGGVHRVRHQHGVVHIEQAQHVGQVALGTVGDEDLILSDLGAAAGVVALNGLLQEGVALLRAIAVEAFLGTHLVGSVMHGLDHALGQRLGHIADAQTDDLLFRVCQRNTFCREKQIGWVSVVVGFVLFILLSPLLSLTRARLTPPRARGARAMFVARQHPDGQLAAAQLNMHILTGGADAQLGHGCHRGAGAGAAGPGLAAPRSHTRIFRWVASTTCTNSVLMRSGKLA